jgi:2-methylcitrate dehydratase PrpD
MSITDVAASTKRTEELAERVMAIRHGELPADVVDRAKVCVLDQLGIEIRGATLPHVQPALTMARSFGGFPQSTVPYTGDRLPAPYAAYVASAFGHSCEYDDSHFLCGHPGVCVIPVVLALGEHRRASGAAVIGAMVAGYEAMVLSIGAIHHGTLTTGWHGTKVAGVFGAAAATTALLDLDLERTAAAFAIAGSEASGTTEYDQSGGEVKRLHAAMAVRSGMEAGLLAEAGMTGPLTIFEGLRGIYRLFGDGGELDYTCWDTPFHIRDVIIKLYPAVGTHHAPIDGLRHLMAEHGFGAEEVESLTVSVAPWAIAHGSAIDRPHDVISAQFSLGFSLALRLVEGSNALPLYLDPDRWRDPSILRLIDALSVEAMTFGPGEPELGANVAVHLKDGRTLQRRQYAFRGHPQEPASFEDVEEKFLGLTDGLIPAETARRIVNTVRTLDQLSDVTALTQLVGGLTSEP